ncbi:VOC family protein [bacterium]|nr:VOC family protein [bacterium]
MRQDGKIDYVEFPATDLPVVKQFYATAFGWSFIDYGPTYAALDPSAGLDGGFDATPETPLTKPLVIMYATDLEAMETKVRAAGGTITVPIFAFPGGRRFHFQDPAGNELAVWSDS